MSGTALSRRAFLRLAGRAGVGVAGIALVGCSSPEAFNDRRDADEEPDAAGERSRPEPAPRPTPAAATEQSQQADDSAGSAAAEPSASQIAVAENPWAGFEPIDAKVWRERYHWSKLAEAPGRDEGPVTGGTITLSMPSPSTFSPLDLSGAGFSTDATVLPLLYSQLVVLDAGDDRDAHRAVAEGDLAAGWEWPDPWTLVFQLRRDAEWPEEGANAAAPLTASDTGRSHDLYRSDYSPHAELYRAVERIDADDAAATVAFQLSEPAGYLLPALTSPHLVVMPPEWEADAPPMFNSAPRGTGPFRLQHHGGPLSSWSVVRRGDYFQATPDAAAPSVSQVHGGILASRSSDSPFSAPREALLADWLSGRLDAIPLAHPAELDEAFGPFPDAVVQVSPPVPGTAPTIYFEWTSDVADPRVRRALSMAIDRQRLIDELHGGLAAPDCGMPWTSVADEASESGFREWPWTLEELGEPFRHDPAGARALFDAAGKVPGAPAKLRLAEPAPGGGITLPSEARIPELVEAVAGQWAQALGGSVEIEFVPRGVERQVNGRTVFVPVPPRDLNVGIAAPQPRYPVDPDPSLAMRGLAAAAVEGDQSLEAARLAELWKAQGRARAADARSMLLEQIRQLCAETMREIPLIAPYGLHVRRANVYNLAATFFSHDPMGAPKQLQRTWKRP